MECQGETYNETQILNDVGNNENKKRKKVKSKELMENKGRM